ncbi:hypothetical protein ABZP36_003676 [Zizania latifolia]
MASSSSFRLPLALVLLLAIIWGIRASPGDHTDEATSTMTKHEKELLLLTDRFHGWMTTHNRKYASVQEKLRRFEVYKRNMEFIETTNRNGNLTFKLGETPFTDLTHEEFIAKYTGGLRVSSERVDTQDADEEDDAVIMTTRTGHVSGDGPHMGAVPDSVDWRTQGAVTPAKYQGPCKLHGAQQRPAGEEGVQVGRDDVDHAPDGLRCEHRPVV